MTRRTSDELETTARSTGSDPSPARHPGGGQRRRAASRATRWCAVDGGIRDHHLVVEIRRIAWLATRNPWLAHRACSIHYLAAPAIDSTAARIARSRRGTLGHRLSLYFREV